MECGGLPPLSHRQLAAVKDIMVSRNGDKPPFKKRRRAAALHNKARGLSVLLALKGLNLIA